MGKKFERKENRRKGKKEAQKNKSLNLNLQKEIEMTCVLMVDSNPDSPRR